jgi:hypothetical protein
MNGCPATIDLIVHAGELVNGVVLLLAIVPVGLGGDLASFLGSRLEAGPGASGQANSATSPSNVQGNL